METADVVIAGAGIIGLSVAVDLATHGLRVVVCERGRPMAEASCAAAGMLAANDPENHPELSELGRLSLSVYPSFLARIEGLSGRSVPLRTSATIQVVPAAKAGFSASHAGFRWLSQAEAGTLEPDLLAPGRRFLLLDEPSLDPRDLCVALPAAALAAGVSLLEQTSVLSVEADEAGVTVRTPTSAIRAAHFVNCAGAWAESPALGRLSAGHSQIAPRKGQMAAVRLRGLERLTRVLRAPEIYLVPRGDGRVVIGATVENAGFDKSVHPHAIAGLLRLAAGLWPPVASAEVIESWAGLRPGSADELPLIGRTAHPHCWIAGGHFRNGMLLAPGTARALSHAIREEAAEIDLAPFDPQRVAFNSPVHSPAAS